MHQEDAASVFSFAHGEFERTQERGTVESVARENFRRSEVIDLRDRLQKLHESLRETLGELAGMGIQVKDVDRGLIDFPAVIDGQDALLCWRLGEPSIAHWHTPEDGFAGRRPLP